MVLDRPGCDFLVVFRFGGRHHVGPLNVVKQKVSKVLFYGGVMKPVAVICNRCGGVLGMAADVAEATAKNRAHSAECEVLNGWV